MAMDNSLELKMIDLQEEEILSLARRRLESGTDPMEILNKIVGDHMAVMGVTLC